MKKVAMITFSLALALSMFFVSGGKSYAAVADGSDPAVTGCSADAVTIDQVPYVGNGNPGDTPYNPSGTIQLRYSPTCRSIWARLILNSPATSTTYEYGNIIRNNDQKQYTCSVTSGNTQCYSPQVNDIGMTSYAQAYIVRGFDSQGNPHFVTTTNTTSY